MLRGEYASQILFFLNACNSFLVPADRVIVCIKCGTLEIHDLHSFEVQQLCMFTYWRNRCARDQ